MKDDKQKEIVVGGIYAFKHPDFGMETNLIVITDKGDAKGRVVAVSHGVADYWKHPFYPRVEFIFEQVGYDATYSDEYQEVRAKLRELEELLESCDKLLSWIRGFAPLLVDDAQALELIRRRITAPMPFKHDQLERIKAKSWMESEAE